MSLGILIALSVSGLFVGFSSALFGVGGGILMVPLLVIAFGSTQHLAEGTSLLVIVPTAIAGVLAQRRSGIISFRHATLLALGGVGGAYLGAALALELPHVTLQKMFAALLLLTGARLLRGGLGTRRQDRRATRAQASDVSSETSPVVQPEPTGGIE